MSGCSPWQGGEAIAELAACLQMGRRSRAGVPFLRSTVMVYFSSPSSWTMRKEIQQLLESFSLHCLLVPVNFLSIRMLEQAWEQFFSKGPLPKALHSTQELQNRCAQLTSAGAKALSPGFGHSWALRQRRQGLPAPAQEMAGIPTALRAISARATYTYLPQGEGQPGHSWQSGGWYPPRHWQRLQ